jgi:hypothetical protein
VDSADPRNDSHFALAKLLGWDWFSALPARGNVIETSEQAGATSTITGFVDWGSPPNQFRDFASGFKFSCWLALRRR